MLCICFLKSSIGRYEGATVVRDRNWK